jgi:nitrate reductase delta subunit
MDSFARATECLSRLVVYPGTNLQRLIDECVVAMSAFDPALGARIRDFRDRTAGLSLAELEEIYIQTFDMNPTCTLDLGWQLFGEDYNRGLFLVKVRQEMRRLGIEESHELPDHLTNVLHVLSRMGRDKAEDFARSCVLPALEKTCSAVNENCPYRLLMDAVIQLLSVHFAEFRKEASDGALV